MSNPLLNNKTTLLIYVIIWLNIAVNHFLILHLLLNLSVSYAVADASAYTFIYFLTGVGLWYPIKYMALDPIRGIRVLLNHLAGALLTSLFWIYSGYFVIQSAVNLTELEKTFLDDSLLWRFNIGVLFYIVIVAIFYVIVYYNNFKDKLEHEKELESLVRDAELRSLKYQINPHFIFNSLNSISSLTVSNPNLAREMTINLSTFLRNTLSKNEQQMNMLSEEIENVKLYMQIEETRFGDNLEFAEEVAEECKKILMPNMLLQPLIENAIKHGVYESTEKITITLSCKLEKEYFLITVQNNFDPEAVSKKGKGIGLKNINNRLKLIYNQDNLLTFNKFENIFTVRIYIPINHAIKNE